MLTPTCDLAAPLAQVLAMSDGVLDLYGLARVGEKRDGEWAYSLGDALNSVRQWADGDGDVTYAAGYRPFGVVLWEEGSSDSAWGYTEEWWDDSAELLYLRARWYEPETGRFISPDTTIPDFHRPQSINRYLYALGNPVRFTDPSGHAVRPPPGYKIDISGWSKAAVAVLRFTLFAFGGRARIEGDTLRVEAGMVYPCAAD